jgi:hypothetical protein
MEEDDLVTDVAYGDQRSKGQMRLWKLRLAREYREFETGCTFCIDIVEDFVKRNSEAGRLRTLKRLDQAFGAGATFEGRHLKGKCPFAVWSILKPRNSVAAAYDPEEPGLTQNCVTINYVLAGSLPSTPNKTTLMTGVWTLELPDHAIGRAIERGRLLGSKLTPDAIVREAHLNLLRLPEQVLRFDASFLVKAGAGGFVCDLRLGRDTKSRFDCHVRIRTPTWLDEDQLHADQILLSEPGAPGKRLGDSWLLPTPLKHIEWEDGYLTATPLVSSKWSLLS